MQRGLIDEAALVIAFGFPAQDFNQHMKRLFDILLSLFLIILLAPVILIVALAVRMNLGAPVLFRQKRPGYRGEPFEMIKFRTMKDAVDQHGMALPDAQRLTKFGRLLRSTSLDELPELWNVFVGTMSFVGPRPLLMQYLPLYSKEQARRHDVLPGLTGWAQINGRNALNWEEKFKLDVWYVDNRTLILDLKILILTFVKVARREGVSAEGEATMKAFEGNHH